MPDSKEKGIMLMATVLAVDMQVSVKTVLYACPAGKSFYPDHLVIRDTSASLAGGNDYDFGTGANCDTWMQTVDLSSMTTPGTDYKKVDPGNTKFAKCAAGSEFGIKPITGSTAACTATIDVFGFIKTIGG